MLVRRWDWCIVGTVLVHCWGADAMPGLCLCDNLQAIKAVTAFGGSYQSLQVFISASVSFLYSLLVMKVQYDFVIWHCLLNEKLENKSTTQDDRIYQTMFV